jgi:nucleoside-diphosphate-sugar epimerase
VIQVYLEAAIQGRDLLVYGSGNRTQDFTFASDAAEACWIAFDRNAHGTFNITGGEPVTMKRLAELAVTCTGNHGSRIVVGSVIDPQDDYRGIFSIEKARRDLGFEPQVGLEDGLAQCVAWHLAAK